MFTTLQAVSGPERSLPDRIPPMPGELMGIGDGGPGKNMPDTSSVVPSPRRAVTSGPSRNHAAPVARIDTGLQHLRGERHASRPAQDPASLRHGWVSWVAFGAGVTSIAAMLTAILVGIILWEYVAFLVLIWVVGALIASVFGAVALGVLTIKYRSVGIAGFIMGVSAFALPFLILIGLIVYGIVAQ